MGTQYVHVNKNLMMHHSNFDLAPLGMQECCAFSQDYLRRFAYVMHTWCVGYKYTQLALTSIMKEILINLPPCCIPQLVMIPLVLH